MPETKTKYTERQLKPLAKNNVNVSNNKLQLLIHHLSNTNRNELASYNLHMKFLFVKEGCSTVKVKFDDIRYIEGLKDYVKIYTSEKSVITKCTIKHIENKLPEELFVRVHKSYIVSIDQIDEIKYNHIFIAEKKIPIGMRFKDSFNEKIHYLLL